MEKIHCPCNWLCHTTKHPCSFSCLGHHLEWKEANAVKITVRIKGMRFVNIWLRFLKLVSPFLVWFFDVDSIIAIAEAGCKKIIKVEVAK